MDTNAENSKHNSKKRLPEALEKHKFQPGVSGNPGGRPKKKPLTELYEDILSDLAVMPQVRKSIVKTLKRGQMAMVLQLKEMAERVEGKITQPVEVEVNIGLADRLKRARERRERNSG